MFYFGILQLNDQCAHEQHIHMPHGDDELVEVEIQKGLLR
jgi:hypothetical protein